LNSFPKQHSNNQLKAKYNLNKKVALIQDLNILMFINCSKTQYMTVGTKQKLAFQNEELSLTINFEKLQHSACEKFLVSKLTQI
jgi:uncharacterized protein YcfL